MRAQNSLRWPGNASYFAIIYDVSFSGLYQYINNSYVVATNQLTATSDFVYNEILFYGKNGIGVGTLGSTVANTFDDASAEIYIKAQLFYDTITPEILTDSDYNKYEGTDIYLIPQKSDGTPLLDTSNVTNMQQMFSNCNNLISIPLLDTSGVTSMYGMFSGCSSLTTMPLFDTSNVTNMYGMFASCKSLISVPLFDTSNVTSMFQMFSSCTNLTIVPQLDISSTTNIDNMFINCPNLSNMSLNNILAMCAGAIAYTGTKTLYNIFGNDMSSYYPASTIQGLSNYSAFTAAGWTIGW